MASKIEPPNWKQTGRVQYDAAIAAQREVLLPLPSDVTSRPSHEGWVSVTLRRAEGR